MRIDQLLVERGVAASRAQAQRLLAGGAQWRVGQGDWRRIAKNGDDVPLEAEVQLQDDAEARYVSRGGLKLAGALAATGLEVSGCLCSCIRVCGAMRVSPASSRSTRVRWMLLI